MRLLALGLLICGISVAQRPSPEQQRRTLDAAREAALHYSAALPDFICTENVQRVASVAGAHNTTTDKLTIQLSYFGQKENYKLVAIDGKQTGQSLESLGGLVSGGEFGSLLLRVFDPVSAADFEWKGWSTIRKRRAAVYNYRIPRARSHDMLGYRTDSGAMATAAAGYHGEVAIETANGDSPMVLRVTAQADDIPKESGILESSSEVDYDFIDVAGRKYLLPVRAEAEMGRPNRSMKNLVVFGSYRKFEADSSIVFH